MDARIELQVASDMPIDIASAVIKYVMGDVETEDDRKRCIAELKEIERHIASYVRCQEELYGVHNVYSLSQTDSGDGLAYDRYVKEEEEKAGHDITDADIYIAQSEYLPQKLGENGVDVNAFSQEVFGYYIVYYR